MLLKIIAASALLGSFLQCQASALTDTQDDWRRTRQVEFAARTSALKPGQDIWDRVEAPRLVALPTGSFVMGSPISEQGRGADEGPQHLVVLGYRLAVGKYHVTRGEYDVFVRATGYHAPGEPGCYTIGPGARFMKSPETDWRHPGFGQTSDDPVVCVSHDDAIAYTDWLSSITGHRYRLLSEAEYEYAERGGTSTPYWWGADPALACRYANGADLDARPHLPLSKTLIPCHDGFTSTAPAGHFLPNAYGLYDMAGNAWTWTEDCYAPSYVGGSADGAAATSGDCSERVIRGGSASSDGANLRSARRFRFAPDIRDDGVGFRVARPL